MDSIERFHRINARKEGLLQINLIQTVCGVHFSYKIEPCSLDIPFVDAETKTMLDESHSDLNLLLLKKLLPSLINLFGAPNTDAHV